MTHEQSSSSRPDLSTPRRVHLIGIGGSGMNAIASVLAEMGHQVSGSDLKHSTGIVRARAQGITAFVGHDADHLGDSEVVAASTAIPAGNVERVAAGERGLTVHRRAEILGAIAARKRTVAVAGTHGKTTTSSMLALILMQAGLHPSFIIGGDVNEIGSGAVWDDGGDLFVVEADESDGTFLALPARAAIVTSVDPDHLDHFGSVDGLHQAFARFTGSVDGPVVVCADDPVAAGLPAGSLTTYGTAPGADVRLTELVSERSSCRFVLDVRGESVPVELAVPGAHNAANATAAAAMAIELGASKDAVRTALARFGGVARRFEFRGEVRGVTLVDDYAHLPAEVAAAVATAKGGGFGRVVTVFQPHRYSRTAAVWPDFADAFDGVDLLVVTGIYSAGEAVQPGITGRLVVRAVLEAHPDQRVAYLETLSEVEDMLVDELAEGDVCLTLGAGDLTGLPDRLLVRLGDPPPS